MHTLSANPWLSGTATLQDYLSNGRERAAQKPTAAQRAAASGESAHGYNDSFVRR